MSRRVVITGVGAVTAVGHTAEETWQAMLAGRSGIGPITLFDPEPYPIRIQAEVKNFELGDRADAKQQRYMNRSVTFGMSAAIEALADSGFQVTEENADMVGVVFGSGAGGTDMVLEHQLQPEQLGQPEQCRQQQKNDRDGQPQPQESGTHGLGL